MWYTITCPDCGKKFTYFTEHGDYAAVDGLYIIIENHELQFKHHDASLERKKTDVNYWIKLNMVKTLEKDPSAYEY
jgi:hypothetical protein